MNDIRFAFRQLSKNPGFTAVAVLTLALGLGANVSMFSIFNAASWHPLPGVKAPREVVYAAEPDRIVHEQYEFYRDQSKSFAGLVGSANGSFRLGGIERRGDGAVVEKIRVRVVTGDYFGVLGAETPLGRYFLPAEYGEANGPPVIVLSHRFWLQHFNGDPGRIGQTLRLEGEPVTIVGVAPESFPGREPSSNFMEPSRSGVDDAPDAWSPLLRQSSNLVFHRGAYDFRLLGRLRSGVSPEQAQTEVALLDTQRAELLGEKRDPHAPHRVRFVAGFARIPPLRDKDEFRGVGSVLALLTLVLLVACANLANLLMARATDRRHEIGIRQALGASRGRLLRQLFTESMLLALMGGAAAVLAGHWTTALLRRVAAAKFPDFRSYIESLEFGVDWRVAAYAAGLSLLSGLLFGLAPVLELVRSNLNPALKEDAARRSRSSLRNLLVIGQVAVSLGLTIVAGLLARSAQVASNRDFAFASREVLFFELSSPAYGVDQTRAFHRLLMERLSALPGVESVGLTSLPKGGDRPNTIFIDGGAPRPLDLGFAGVNYFSPGYLETLKIPILHGRNFSAEDIRSEAAVAILSESMARRYWPNENAIGKQFKLGPRAPLFEVIGITRDAMPAGLRETAPGGHLSFFYSAFAGDLFLPLSANVSALGAASLVVRVPGQPKAMIPLVTKTIQSLDANITVTAQVLREMMDAGLAPLVGASLAASGLGLLALLLATMGIYGVMAYVVSRRTREVGVRMALGARKTDVLRLVIGDGMRVVFIGVFVGIIGALCLAQLLSSKLFGLSPHDPLSFIVVSGISVLAALLACYLPARRASKIEPMEALRYE